jgi:hypothetical protein
LVKWLSQPIEKETAMTVQIAEILHYQGRQMELYTEPLFDYFALQGIDPGFEARSDRLRRGYLATWEIHDECLYLTGIQANLMDGNEADLFTLFPQASRRVFAVWYSGPLRVRDGSQEFFLDLVCGMVKSNRPMKTIPSDLSAVADAYAAPEARLLDGEMRR